MISESKISATSSAQPNNKRDELAASSLAPERSIMNKDVIIALDFENKETTLAFLDKFQDRKPFVKIGMELFYSEGPEIVREIKARGHKVFLDLKLHDIPNTVEKAMARLAGL